MPTFSQRELMAYNPPKQEWIIDQGLLLPGTRMAVMGPQKSWKSMLVSIDLAHKLASGTPWIGFSTRASSTLVVQVEIPLIAFRDRVTAYTVGHTLLPEQLYFNNDMIKLGRASSNSFNNLLSLMKKLGTEVLILDPLYKVIWGNPVETEDMIGFTDCVDRLIYETGGFLSVVIVHHTGKPQFASDGSVISRGSRAALGSSIFNNWYDTGIVLNPVGEDRIRVEFEDLRLAPNIIRPKMLYVDRHSLTFREEAGQLETGLM